jgi:hypothetical protein
VPFPRDWLGPRDELVPFGPGTDRRTGRPRHGPSPEGPWSSGEPDPPAADEGFEPEPPTGPGAALRPEDFWEGTAVQEVIAVPADPVPGRLGIASRTGLPRRATRTLIAVRQLLAPRFVLAAVCAIAGICIVVLGARPHSAPRRSAATHHPAPDTRSLEAALLPLSIPSKSRRARPHRGLHSTGITKSARHADRAARTPVVAAGYTPVSTKPTLTSSPTSDSTTVADRPSAPAASTSDYASQTPVQRNTSSGSSNYSGSAAPSSISSSGGSSNASSGSPSAPAQPTAQTSSAASQPVGAFGQNGVLGAGSSPNG